MRFDSAQFLFFFLGVLFLHRVVPRARLLLIASSYLFYASWNPPFLLLLLFSTALDYTVGRRLGVEASPRRRRGLLAISIVGNLGVLAYFKYVDFLLEVLVDLGAPASALAAFRVEAEVPLGISFYTFQTLSYAVDVYRGSTKPCRSFLDFALFVSFFPQLIAGPIMRSSELLPQIRSDPRANSRDVWLGIELCLVGLFKKVVLADTFAELVDAGFEDPAAWSGPSLLVVCFAFSAQIYCDFSGYTTMARGLARLLGFELPRNFEFPLLATNPIEYRRRWHVTMATWFRDYVYHPLGGDRRGLARTLFNTLVVWVAFGFWHGASWTFLLWGLFNGLLLVAWRLTKVFRPARERSRAAAALGVLSMPLFICLTNVMFRSPDTQTALTVYERIFTLAPGELHIHPFWAVCLAVLFGLHWFNYLFVPEGRVARAHLSVRLAFLVVFTALLALFAGSGAPFYYFQF